MLHYDTYRGLSDLPTVVRQTVDALAPHADEFDSIAVQGTSGLVIGAPVALAMRKPLVIVREDAELQCHHSKDVENAANAGERVLFLDDQISSGSTFQDVKRKLSYASAGHVVATYLYQYNEYKANSSVRAVPRQRQSVDDILAMLRGNPWR